MVSQVLYCDFLSMYPTVCTLMGLWRFVIAKGIEWRDSTSEICDFLEMVTLSDLRRPEIWPALTSLVQVRPDDDIFPVRANYDGEEQATIGLNYLANNLQWFTLADCIVSTLLVGKPPEVHHAITFTPGGLQDGLMPINIFGKAITALGDTFGALPVEGRVLDGINVDVATARAMNPLGPSTRDQVPLAGVIGRKQFFELSDRHLLGELDLAHTRLPDVQDQYRLFPAF
jgi:hypothetical protein